MRLARLAGLLGVAAVIVASGATPAAGDDPVHATCTGGEVTVTGVRPWHTNPNAPWAWDKGSLVSKDQHQVKFQGPRCEGSVRAFIASGDASRGPILIPIK